MDRDYSCVNCKEAFKSGAWYGCRGNKTRKHVVESKTYYSESDRLCVNVVPSSTMLGERGERISIQGIIITFNGGVFISHDPEVQEVLDVKCPMTREQYVDARTSTEMKNARLRNTVKEQQVLIEQLRAKVENKHEQGPEVPAAEEVPVTVPEETPARRPRTRSAG